MSRPPILPVGEKPADHASYRVRPRQLHPMLAHPIKFSTNTDVHARFVFRSAKASLIAQGMPMLDLVLERQNGEAWDEIAEDRA